MGGGRRRIRRARARGGLRGIRAGRLEVELSPGAVENDGGAVVSARCVLGGGEGAEPLAGALTRLADLGDPFAPAALSDATVAELVVVGTTFAFTLPGGSGGGGNRRRR